MAGDFGLIRRLGAGHFGEVWLVHDRGLGAERAVKFIPRDKVVDPNDFFREAQILKAAEHPNIVPVQETGTMADGRLYVAMQFLQRGSLEDESRGSYVVLSRTRRLMIDVLRGLDWAHGKSILHRDIKPANILIGDDNRGVLSDFGLAVKLGPKGTGLSVRDYAYAAHKAPEIGDSGKYSIASDIYACGVTLYRLVNGDSYLPALPITEMLRGAARGLFPNRDKYREFVPRQLRLVVNKAMSVKPTERYPTAEAMRRALESVPIYMNWDEKELPNGICWKGTWKDTLFCVEKIRTGKARWSVIVKRGKSASSARRLTDLCVADVAESVASRSARRILQGLVTGNL